MPPAQDAELTRPTCSIWALIPRASSCSWLLSCLACACARRSTVDVHPPSLGVPGPQDCTHLAQRCNLPTGGI
jgi:hypothetical protein